MEQNGITLILMILIGIIFWIMSKVKKNIQEQEHYMDLSLGIFTIAFIYLLVILYNL